MPTQVSVKPNSRLSEDPGSAGMKPRQIPLSEAYFARVLHPGLKCLDLFPCRTQAERAEEELVRIHQTRLGRAL